MAAPPPAQTTPLFEENASDSDAEERERRAQLGKLYPLAPPRALPPFTPHDGPSILHTYEDGSVYAGDWRRGMRSGWGVFTLGKPRIKYAGEWRTNCYDGLGIVWYPSGNRYEGEFHCDLRHGRGLFLWKTTARGLLAASRSTADARRRQGEMYYGHWEMDLRSGIGCHHWPDGSKARRAALSLRRVLTLACAQYEGEWAYGVPHGRGRYLWSDGARALEPSAALSE
jgi:hypothetical protein